MAWLTQGFLIWFGVTLVTGHVVYGHHHHHTSHDISELPQLISSMVQQHLGHHFFHQHPLFSNGGIHLNSGSNENTKPLNTGFNFDSSNIFGGNFGAQDHLGSSATLDLDSGSQNGGGLINSDESYIQNPGNVAEPEGQDSGIYDSSEIPNYGINIEMNLPNVQNITNEGENGDSNEVDMSNPGTQVVNDNSSSGDVSRDNSNNGEDSSVSQNGGAEAAADLPAKEEQVINGQGTSDGDGNKIQNSDNSIDTNQATANINLNDPNESLNNVNVNAIIPNSSNDQNIGVDGYKINSQNNVLDNPLANTKNQSNLSTGLEGQVLDGDIKNINIPKPGAAVALNNIGVNSQSQANTGEVSDISQDGKLKTNVPLPENDSTDYTLTKHRDKATIVFPDQLDEAKTKIEKEKANTNDIDTSQSGNINDRNGYDNGKILYAINIAPTLSSANLGSYVTPSTPVNNVPQNNYAVNNVQNQDLNGQSSTPVQYITQNPTNTVSNTVPNNNVVSTNPNGGTSNSLTVLNVPNNPGQVSYSIPASTGNQPGYYLVNNPNQQLYYAVQLNNGQNAFVPVSSGQVYVSSNGQSNGQGQVMVPNNNQQFVVSTGQPIQSNGQIVISGNNQQYIPSNVNGQVIVSNNGQQYIPNNSNGQIYVSSDGKQYIQANTQPAQSTAQIVVPTDGQQYVLSNAQPANGQVLVPSTVQSYVANGQASVPWNGGQNMVQNNGQVVVPLNQPSNVVSVPSGSLVSVGGSNNDVPLLVFKDKVDPSSDSSEEKLEKNKDEENSDGNNKNDKNTEGEEEKSE